MIDLNLRIVRSEYVITCIFLDLELEVEVAVVALCWFDIESLFWTSSDLDLIGGSVLVRALWWACSILTKSSSVISSWRSLEWACVMVG